MDNRPQARSTEARRAEALERLLEEKRSMLLRHIRRHSADPQQAEDVLGEACVQFMRFWDAGRSEDPLPWMLVVSKRCAWAAARQRRRLESRRIWRGPEPEHRPPEEKIKALGPDPAESAERSEELTRLIELIEDLKPDERTALLLLGLGCSYTEIGELRGWTYTKVNRCIAEGREAVRRRLGEGESWD